MNLLAVLAILFFMQTAIASRSSEDVVFYNPMSEITSLDPNKQLDGVSGFWLGHIYEGLVAYDINNNLRPAQAERIVKSKDGLTYKFFLRKNAKWHDGRPVEAQNFVDSWQRLVDPKYASGYSFIAESAQIKNASQIISGKLPPRALGVRAIHKDELEVTLNLPVPYFLSMMALNPFFPVRSDLIKKYNHQFGLVEKSVIGNGPFGLEKWENEKTVVLKKSESYWNSKRILLKKIIMPFFLKDSRSTYLSFQVGNLDIVDQLDKESLTLAQKNHANISSSESGVVWYLSFNQNPGKLFSNKNLRENVNKHLNIQEYVNRISALPGRKVATGFVPTIISNYRKQFPILPMTPSKIDSKLKKIPKKEISFLVGSMMGTEAQNYFQQELQKILQMNVVIEAAPFKVRQQKLKDGDFDIAFISWIPDYDDPLTYLEIFESNSSINNTGFKNIKFDSFLKAARQEIHPKKRFELLYAAEKLLLDEAVVLPVEFSARNYITAPQLKNVRRRVFGPDPDFRFAFYEKK